MCDPISAAVVGAAVLGAGASVASSSKAASAQKSAQQANERQAAQNAQRSEEQFNRANQKVPDIAGMLARNQQAANQGLAATFLTGPGGVSNSSLSLGKTTLLGGGTSG
jgi:type II secretory pathway pseudopilin PulG